MTRILVTGSRDWPWSLQDVIGSALLDVVEAADKGGARGADQIAARWAGTWRWNVEHHPADWIRHGKAAGIIRNAEMVNAGADICLAFIRDGSRGATHCADLAEKAGIPTRRYTP